MGCGKLDYLILTHFDEDHLSGVEALLARIPVEHLLVPASEAQQAVLDLARTYETAVQVVDVPVELSAETGTVTVYPPPEGETEDNERGLSVLAFRRRDRLADYRRYGCCRGAEAAGAVGLF